MSTNAIESRKIIAASAIGEKSGPIGPVSKVKIAFFIASIPYVRGFTFAAICKISGRSLTGYIAPERKNMGIMIKFIMTLKLS